MDSQEKWKNDIELKVIPIQCHMFESIVTLSKE